MLWALFWLSELLQPMTWGSPALLCGQPWASDPVVTGPCSAAAPAFYCWGCASEPPDTAGQAKGEPTVRGSSCPANQRELGGLVVPAQKLTSGVGLELAAVRECLGIVLWEGSSAQTWTWAVWSLREDAAQRCTDNMDRQQVQMAMTPSPGGMREEEMPVTEETGQGPGLVYCCQTPVPLCSIIKVKIWLMTEVFVCF